MYLYVSLLPAMSQREREREREQYKIVFKSTRENDIRLACIII